MLFAFTVYSFIFAVAAVLTLISAAAVLWRRSTPGSLYFSLNLISLSIWSFASIFEAGALTVEGKFISSVWQYIGIASLSPFWVYFSAEYSGHKKVFKRPYVWLIWIIPVLAFLLAATNNFHGLIWRDILLPQGSIGNIADYVHGYFYYVFTIYIYILLFIGTFWLLNKLSSFSKERRSQVFLVITLVVIGWVANLLYQVGLSPIHGLDLTPLSFAFIGLALTWFIYRRQLFDLIPVARTILMDNMTDGVIVLDDFGRVVDINQSALEITRYKGNHPIGMTIWEMYKDYLPQINHLKDQSDIQEELRLPTDPPRYLDIKIDSIGDIKGHGQVITIRDVTSRKLVEIEEREQRLYAEALAEITSLLNSSLNLDQVLEQILDNINKVVPHDAANIALVDEKGVLRFRKVKGYEKYGTREIVLGLETRVSKVPNLKRMAETGSPSINPDTHADPEWVKDMPGAGWIQSYIGAPIISSGTLLGFINLDASIPNFFRTDHMYRLQTIANQAAVAIRNAQLYEEMEYLAITDSLTGLYNRRYFFEFARKEIAQSKRYRKDLSIIMMDIDHFKRVNDRFGHQMGDQVLENVSKVCHSLLRTADIMCRFGGEEFIVLLPETDKADAENAALRMCQAAAESTLEADLGEIKITLSIGVAELDKEHDTLDTLISAVDKALYQAKADGRNCVRVFS